MSDLATSIWEWRLQRQIYLSAIHTDGLSRPKLESTELMLDSNVFRQIAAVYQQPQLDFFASHQNHQLPNYFSWIPDPQAMGTDAFSIPWKFKLCYLFPPFPLIQKCIQKIKQAKIDVLPVWKSRPWYPLLPEMLITASSQIASSSSVPISSSPYPINEKEDQTCRLACIGRSFKERGISERVSKILLSSWRSSTEKHYQSAWKSFDSWCFEKSENPISCHVNIVFEFLTDLLDKSLQYRTVNN